MPMTTSYYSVVTCDNRLDGCESIPNGFQQSINTISIEDFLANARQRVRSEGWFIDGSKCLCPRCNARAQSRRRVASAQAEGGE